MDKDFYGFDQHLMKSCLYNSFYLYEFVFLCLYLFQSVSYINIILLMYGV